MCERIGASELPYSTREIAEHGGGSRLADNPPDAPAIATIQMLIDDPDKPVAFLLGEEKESAGTVVTIKRPLLRFREIPVGGVRTIGGGTSRDAFRREKKKLRNGR